MIQEPLKPIDDIIVWVKVQKLLRANYPDCIFRLKENDQGELSVIYNNANYQADDQFQSRICEILAEHFGEEILERTIFSCIADDRFDIIY